MTLEHTLEIVKILLRHYGEHPSQNDALIAGALVILVIYLGWIVVGYKLVEKEQKDARFVTK
jgi:hypothetical protein